MSLTRDQVQSAPAGADLPRQKCHVPELAAAGTDPKGCYVFVRTLTAAEKDDLENNQITGSGKDRKQNLANYRARVAVAVCVDDAGKSVFMPGDETWLGQRSGPALTRICTLYHRLNNVSEEDVAELVGESVATQS